MLGYHVLRAKSLDEPFQPIYEDLILVSGPGGILANEYIWQDISVLPGYEYYYSLGIEDTLGNIERIEEIAVVDVPYILFLPICVSQ